MRNTRAIGGLAISVGAIIATSVASLAAFYAIGGRGPFGTINDVGNGTAGLLSAVLAWSLRRQGIGGRLGLVSAVAGGAVSVVGSLLVITNRTGWVFAGLVSGVGFALLGVWLFALNRALDGSRFPRGLRRLGTVAGGGDDVGLHPRTRDR